MEESNFQDNPILLESSLSGKTRAKGCFIKNISLSGSLEIMIKWKDKCQMLEEDFYIEMTQTLESEVSLMCNLSKGVEEKGIEKGKIYGAISMCRDLDLPEEIILEKLQKKFYLSEEQVKEYLQTAE